MVAIVSGNSLGLSLSSLAVLGQRGVFGNATQGSSGDGAYVDVSNGNLVWVEIFHWFIYTVFIIINKRVLFILFVHCPFGLIREFHSFTFVWFRLISFTVWHLAAFVMFLFGCSCYFKSFIFKVR